MEPASYLAGEKVIVQHLVTGFPREKNEMLVCHHGRLFERSVISAVVADGTSHADA